jgi:hypothetical protein
MIDIAEIWRGIESRVLALIHRSEARGARVISSVGLTVPSGALTALAFDTEIQDTDGCWSAGEPTKLYAQREGYYLAGGGFELLAAQNTVASRCAVYVRRNGTVVLGANDNHTIANKGVVVSFATGMFWMGAGEYVEILALQDQGADRQLRGANAANQHFCNGWLMRVG